MVCLFFSTPDRFCTKIKKKKFVLGPILTSSRNFCTLKKTIWKRYAVKQVYIVFLSFDQNHPRQPHFIHLQTQKITLFWTLRRDFNVLCDLWPKKCKKGSILLTLESRTSEVKMYIIIGSDIYKKIYRIRRRIRKFWFDLP